MQKREGRGPRDAKRLLDEAIVTGASVLDISDLGLVAVPDAIGQLTCLQQLSVRGNRLTTLPEAIGQLEHLQELDLSRNRLTVLPKSIWQLSQLKCVYVADNNITSLPETIRLLRWLEQLDLSHNKLTALPESIGQLRELRRLIIADNELSELSESIGELRCLQELDVSLNRLTTLPEAIGKLTELKLLSLSGNQLTALPEAIGHLAKLQELDASGNQLIALPETMMGLSTLQLLLLHWNEPLTLPSDVLGPNRKVVVTKRGEPARPRAILEYYFRTRVARRPLNEAKLILIGFGAVGKTSLVKRLVYDTFNQIEQKTEGIAITEWPLTLSDGDMARLHIWDFGGQEIMHATHQFFLTERSLYLLVLNGRQGREDADAEYWLSIIDSFAPRSPVIIVLNKIHEHSFTIDRRSVQSKFPNIQNVIQTDCDDRTGIDLLSRAIQKETDQLEHLRDPFPGSWFAIKERLAGMKENYLTFDQYREICDYHGEVDRQAQDDLAHILHSLGIALNYKDDPRLRDTNVLNPRWVTEGVYLLLNAHRLAAQKGELWLKDVGKILNPVTYPTERHPFILELMRKFELCFRFPEEDDHYLIPELLDKEQPSEVEALSTEPSLQFQYQYPVMPEGLLPRFIVRTYVLSAGLPRWRTGVVLQFEGNRALITADFLRKCIRISVTGPLSGRRRLLAIIRAEFEQVHASYKFQPEAMVPVPEHPSVFVPYVELRGFEQNGVSLLPKLVGGKVIHISVSEALGEVDLPKDTTVLISNSRPLRLFYSYSHKDEELRDELETHLTLLERRGLIEPWHDRRITAGGEWRDQIDTNLDQAQIILLLVSADFMASGYCWNLEMKRALEKHGDGSARVIPIIIREVQWQSSPIGKLQALPRDGRAVTAWGIDRYAHDGAWRNVAEGIEKLIYDIRKSESEKTARPTFPRPSSGPM